MMKYSYDISADDLPQRSSAGHLWAGRNYSLDLTSKPWAGMSVLQTLLK